VGASTPSSGIVASSGSVVVTAIDTTSPTFARTTRSPGSDPRTTGAPGVPATSCGGATARVLWA
jgi:hypothetical protein